MKFEEGIYICLLLVFSRDFSLASSSKITGRPLGVARRSQKLHDHARKITTSIRGGDLAGVESKTLAKVFTGMVSLDALSGTFMPKSCCEWFGIEVAAKSVRLLTIEAIGGAAGGLFITSVLALMGKVSTEKAIAYGLSSPILFLLRSFLNNRDISLDTPQLALWALSAGALFILNLCDVATPTLAMKAVFGLNALMCFLAYCNPSLGKMISGVDAESEGELTTHLYRCACGYQLIYSTVCFLLLNKVDPVKAIGYAAALTMAWTFEMGTVTKIQQYLPKVWWSNGFMFAVMTVLLGGISFGILSDPSVTTK